MHHVVYVAGPHFDEWFKLHPGVHRTDHQGQRIICPHMQGSGYPAVELFHRASQTHECLNCGAALAHAKPIGRHDQSEFYWPQPATPKPGVS